MSSQITRIGAGVRVYRKLRRLGVDEAAMRSVAKEERALSAGFHAMRLLSAASRQVLTCSTTTDSSITYTRYKRRVVAEALAQCANVQADPVPSSTTVTNAERVHSRIGMSSIDSL